VSESHQVCNGYDRAWSLSDNPTGAPTVSMISIVMVFPWLQYCHGYCMITYDSTTRWQSSDRQHSCWIPGLHWWDSNKNKVARSMFQFSTLTTGCV